MNKKNVLESVIFGVGSVIIGIPITIVAIAIFYLLGIKDVTLNAVIVGHCIGAMIVITFKLRQLANTSNETK